MWISNISIRRPVFATMFIMSFMVLGVVSMTRLGIDLFPDVSFPFVNVTIVYPGDAGRFSKDQVRDAVVAIGLPQLAERLDEEAHWNRMLSLGEQQRLGIARALLQAPDFLFLDEATASLDEPSEAALYKLLQERLAGSTIVSIGHRSTLTAFHKRRLEFVRATDGFTIREAAGTPAK